MGVKNEIAPKGMEFKPTEFRIGGKYSTIIRGQASCTLEFKFKIITYYRQLNLNAMTTLAKKGQLLIKNYRIL